MSVIHINRIHEFCTQHQLPIPAQNSTEILRNLLVFRNSLFLERQICSATGKPILSAIPAAAGLEIYDSDYWSSDRWDAREFGREYDPTRSFFEQLQELMRAVPFPNRGVVVSTLQNTEYANDLTSAKDCYLIFCATQNERCIASQWMWRNRELLDCAYAFDSELCFDCWNIRKCFELICCRNCEGCTSSAFLTNCIGCKQCYGCCGLNQAQFCFFNKQLSEVEYRKAVGALDLSHRTVFEQEQRRYGDFLASQLATAQQIRWSEDSDGNYLSQVRNCHDCYFIGGSQDLTHCLLVERARTCAFQVSYGDNSELVYMSTGCGDNAYNLKWCWECWMNVSNLEYCMYVTHGCSDCFGCVGLSHARNCILNREYSPGAFAALKERIKVDMIRRGEWGRFFPVSLSPHCYNRSWGAQFAPLSQAEALGQGFRWAEDPLEAHVPEAKILPHCLDGYDTVSLYQSSDAPSAPFRCASLELEILKKLKAPGPVSAPIGRLKTRFRDFAIIA